LSAARIRAATPADAQEIARVHVQAWHESYRGLLPDAMLDALSVDRNARMWAEVLASEAIVRVVETPEGVVGFGSAGAARSAALGTTGEVTSIYLVDRVKRHGIGRALFASLLQALAARGHASVGLWVLVDNHGTRRFYDVLGGRAGATRSISGKCGDLCEIAYTWENLARFAVAD